jgi:hypothetical protein
LPGVNARWACARREAVVRAASDCLAPRAVPSGSELDENEPAGTADRLLTRRLLVMSALAKGVPPEDLGARGDLEWRSQSSATR